MIHAYGRCVSVSQSVCCCFGVCFAMSLFSGPPVLSSLAQETSFFLFNTFSIQVELCGVRPGDETEGTVFILMFLPEVISSPKPCWWEKA